MEKKYRVFTDNEHEYDIEISEDDHVIYNLVRKGSTWSEKIRNQPAISIINDGNGYHFTNISKMMDYAETMELQTLLQFVTWYETQHNKVPSSVVTIESCKEKIRFTM